MAHAECAVRCGTVRIVNGGPRSVAAGSAPPSPAAMPRRAPKRAGCGGRHSRPYPFVLIFAALAICGAGCGDSGGDEQEIQQGTLIRLADGMVQGEIDGGTRRFLGIPFTAPPVGELRWRPPAPVTKPRSSLPAGTSTAAASGGAHVDATALDVSTCGSVW